MLIVWLNSAKNVIMDHSLVQYIDNNSFFMKETIATGEVKNDRHYS